MNPSSYQRASSPIGPRYVNVRPPSCERIVHSSKPLPHSSIRASNSSVQSSQVIRSVPSQPPSLPSQPKPVNQPSFPSQPPSLPSQPKPVNQPIKQTYSKPPLSQEPSKPNPVLGCIEELKPPPLSERIKQFETRNTIPLTARVTSSKEPHSHPTSESKAQFKSSTANAPPKQHLETGMNQPDAAMNGNQKNVQPHKLSIPPPVEGQMSLSEMLEKRAHMNTSSTPMKETCQSSKELRPSFIPPVPSKAADLPQSPQIIAESDAVEVVNEQECSPLFTANGIFLAELQKEDVKMAFSSEDSLPFTGIANVVMCLYPDQLCFYLYDKVNSKYDFIVRARLDVCK